MRKWVLSVFSFLVASQAYAQSNIHIDLSVLDYLDSSAQVMQDELPLPAAKKAAPMKKEVDKPQPKPQAILFEGREIVPMPMPVVEVRRPETEIIEAPKAAPQPKPEAILFEGREIVPMPMPVAEVRRQEVEPEVVEEDTVVLEEPEQAMTEQSAEPVDDSKAVIVFANDSQALTAEDRARLGEVVKNFENTAVNKILIVAYNYDSGESVFKQKRLSLNRATEIRSYLLGLGYKNFSIKIINTDDSSQNNLAEVTELK